MNDQRDDIIEKQQVRLHQWSTWGRKILAAAKAIPAEHVPSDNDMRTGLDKLLRTKTTAAVCTAPCTKKQAKKASTSKAARLGIDDL